MGPSGGNVKEGGRELAVVANVVKWQKTSLQQ